MPHQFRQTFAAFLRAVSSVSVTCDDTDVGSWWALMALPRLCLPAKNPIAMQERPEAYNIKGLLSRFIRGVLRSLWELATWRDRQALSLDNRAPGIVRTTELSPNPEQVISASQVRRANLYGTSFGRTTSTPRNPRNTRATRVRPQKRGKLTRCTW